MNRARLVQVVVPLVFGLLLGGAWVLHERMESARWRFSHGHGYWSVRELVPNRHGYWERFARYERLFDGPVDLGLVGGRFSVSPNGDFAAFERDDLVLVYDRHRGAIDTVGFGHTGEGGLAWGVDARTLSFKSIEGTTSVVHLAPKPKPIR